MVLDIPDLAELVTQRGQKYAFVVVNRLSRNPSPLSTTEMNLAGEGQLFQIDGLHLADGIALALENRLVSVAAVPEIVDQDFTVSPPGSWLLRRVPWTQAESRISAVGVRPSEAKLLQLAPGSPCLSLERRTWRGSERITDVRQLFPGDRHDLLARFDSLSVASSQAQTPEPLA